jgi:hypothetical protein
MGESRIGATVPMIYFGDKTCDVRRDTGTPVSEGYPSSAGELTGEIYGNISGVQLDAGVDSHDHLVSPEELMGVATTIQ